jgi:hypothetical protein
MVGINIAFSMAEAILTSIDYPTAMSTADDDDAKRAFIYFAGLDWWCRDKVLFAP